MKKVFLCEFIHPEAYAYLKNHAEIISSWDQFSEADAVIDRNFKITEELLQTTDQLKVIGVHGTGTDDVDLEAAKRHGVEVFSVPHQNAQSVAEMNVALMLAIGRKVVLADRAVSNMAEPKANLFAELQGTEFSGKTLGLIGVGEISKRTANICKYGLGMSVLGWSRHMSDEEAKELGIIKADNIDYVFEQADVIMIGLSLDDSTRGLIGKAQFDKMKKTAFLINSTRGAILDEEALYIALRDGKMAGAACDVFIKEPLTVENKLLKLPNFVGTPHLGANTDDALKRVGMAVVNGVLERLERLN